MSAPNVKRLIWLVSYMARHPYGVTKKELDVAWINSGLGTNPRIMPRQTLNNLIEGVGTAFGLNIIHDKQKRRWVIENPEYLDDNRYKNWLIETFSIASLLKEHANIQKYILIENDKQIKANLELILQAISEGRTVKFQHNSANKDKCQQIELLPYFVEQYNHRWYVVGKIEDACYQKLSALGVMLAQQHKIFDLVRWLGGPDMLKVISLENISELEVTDNKYQMPQDFDPLTIKTIISGPLMHKHIGIDGKAKETLNDKLKQNLVIKAKGFAMSQIMQKPLNPNQELLEEFEAEDPQDSYKVFKCRVCISTMLLYNLMKYGDQIEILHPESVKEKMREIIEKTLEKYKK